MIHSYPSVFQIGHKAIEHLFDGPVSVTEKIDGSQISFGILDGELQIRSKNKQLMIDAPEKMFGRAVEIIKELQQYLHPGWTYRGEYLSAPKHNTIAYARVPNNNIIIYDINTGLEEYADYEKMSYEAARFLHLEVVPEFYRGVVNSMEQFKSLLDRESCLGGSKVEGIVIKNYAQFTQEKKVAMGKYVSEIFSELNKDDWKKRNPSGKDIVSELIARYSAEGRFKKAIQHLKERCELEQSLRDIGPLMREIPEDVRKECEEEIKERLFNHYWPQISRGITRGVPQWYKEELAKLAFVPESKEED